MNLPETRPLTLGSVLAALALQLDERLQWQVIDSARPDTGALLAHDTGLADASHTASSTLHAMSDHGVAHAYGDVLIQRR